VLENLLIQQQTGAAGLASVSARWPNLPLSGETPEHGRWHRETSVVTIPIYLMPLRGIAWR
jgi:hypothetical protein